MDLTIVIYFSVLGAICLVALRAPAAAVGVYLCTYALEQWAQSRSGFFYVYGSLTNFATVATLLFALSVRQIRGEGWLRGGMPLNFWIVTALLVWAAISLMWSPYDQATANYTSSIPYLGATILVMPLLIRNLDDLRVALTTMLLIGSPIMLAMFLDDAWTGRRITLQQGAAIGSVVGKGGNPLALASLSGYVGAAALLINFRGVGRAAQVLRFPLILLCLIIAFRSGSRGQLFAMVAAGIVFLPMSRRIKNIAGFVGAAAGIGLILVLATYAYDLYAFGGDDQRWDVGNMVDTYSGSRLGTSGELLAAWSEAGPIAWLVGLGSSASYEPDIVGFYPHLVMAEVLGELGFIGFVMLWAIVIVAARDLWSIQRRAIANPVARGMSAAVGAIFLFEVILSFKQGSLLGSSNALGMAVVIGRVAASCRQGEPISGQELAADSHQAANGTDLSSLPAAPPPPAPTRPRRRVTPVFLPDQKPTAAGF